MNDRASQKPPAPYIGTDDGLLDRYEHERGDTRGRKAQSRQFTHHPKESVRSSSVIDTSRHSSIFRFGKSLAASFNPSNWKIWSKQQRPQEDEETEPQRILRERQEKAQRIYNELKQSGHFRDSTFVHQNFQGPDDQKVSPDKHDSGVAFGEDAASNHRASREMSREDKRKDRIFLEPPKLSNNRGESPASMAGSAVHSNTSSPSKQSFHFKKPSLLNMKKSFPNDSVSDSRHSGEHQARRISSRKDLQKQQKLVKRVSDLEGKLEAARRQLAEALDEPLPPKPPPMIGRSRFVPGAMPTLPSERLLSAYVESETGFSDEEAYSNIGKTILYDELRLQATLISGTRAGDDKSEVGNVKVASSPAWVGKPLPQQPPPKDHVLPSVETDDLVEHDEPETSGSVSQSNSPKAVTTVTEPSTNPSESQDNSQEQEGSPKESSKPGPVKPVTKKRKSTFVPLADDGGRYKPGPDSESDPESEAKKVTTRKKKAAAPTRNKLQKISHTTTNQDRPPKNTTSTHIASLQSSPPNKGISKPLFQLPSKGIKTNTNSSPSSNQTPPRANCVRPSKKAALVISASSSSKLVKSKPIQNQGRQQSVSPPPSSSFTGLDYTKPSKSPKHNLESPSKEEIYIANPSNEDDIPPMPKLPSSVRLPSGEFVSTALSNLASATPGASKLTKAKKLTKENKNPVRGQEGGKNNENKEPNRKQSFEWPEDVF
jgi:hypothetical protein